MSDTTGWLVELDNILTVAVSDCSGGLRTASFTDPAAMRFKQRGDAEEEMRQLEARFPWMQGRLAVREHMWLDDVTRTAEKKGQP